MQHLELPIFIHKAYIAKDIKALVFFLSNYISSALVLSAKGDCCASCWIEHISNSEALQGAFIKQMDIKMLDEKYNDTQDIHESWGYKLITDKGICDIDMRVEHNGYYGGELKVDHPLNYTVSYDKDPYRPYLNNNFGELNVVFYGGKKKHRLEPLEDF